MIGITCAVVASTSLTAAICPRDTFRGGGLSRLTSHILALLWAVHYGNRGWYFPLNIRVASGQTASFNIMVSGIGAVFTGLHGHLNATMP